MTNKYVNFISDEDFINCVKHVVDTYKIEKTNNIEKNVKTWKKILQIL